MTDFFFTNQDILLFLYGLIFFQLGMAIALHSRNHSRLDLARNLRWLAWFGILHGLYEWGDLFIPIQANYLSVPWFRLLQVSHLILLGLSFSALLEFGVALLRPFGRKRWWHGLPLGIFLCWIFVVFYILLPFSPVRDVWLRSSSALARYAIGFPGSLLAAYGLSKQARLKIAPLAEPRYVQLLATASLALALYAVLAGLIPQPVPFFPGNLINTSTFTSVVGVPPFLLRSLVGLVLAFCMIRGLEIFGLEVDRMIESIQQQQILADERDRIGRELHDGVIQKVYTAGLLVDSAARLASSRSPLSSRLNRATETLNDVITDLRHNLEWLRPLPSGIPLHIALEEISRDPRYCSLINVQLFTETPVSISLSPLRTEQVLAIVHGALSNAIRHGQARSVKLNLSQDGRTILLSIQDDGAGFPEEASDGFGLRNMRDRARLLDGEIEIQGAPNKGTLVNLKVPIKEYG